MIINTVSLLIDIQIFKTYRFSEEKLGKRLYVETAAFLWERIYYPTAALLLCYKLTVTDNPKLKFRSSLFKGLQGAGTESRSLTAVSEILMRSALCGGEFENSLNGCFQRGGTLAESATFAFHFSVCCQPFKIQIVLLPNRRFSEEMLDKRLYVGTATFLRIQNLLPDCRFVVVL